jgi:molybdopterin biosynthesis enzyme MoaB
MADSGDTTEAEQPVFCLPGDPDAARRGVEEIVRSGSTRYIARRWTRFVPS